MGNNTTDQQVTVKGVTFWLSDIVAVKVRQSDGTTIEINTAEHTTPIGFGNAKGMPSCNTLTH